MEGSLFLLKAGSKYGDKIWAAVGYSGYVFDRIKLYNYKRNSEEVLVECHMVLYLAQLIL